MQQVAAQQAAIQEVAAQQNIQTLQAALDAANAANQVWKSKLQQTLLENLQQKASLEEQLAVVQSHRQHLMGVCHANSDAIDFYIFDNRSARSPGTPGGTSCAVHVIVQGLQPQTQRFRPRYIHPHQRHAW